MSKSRRKWIQFDWEKDGCVRAQDIPYDFEQSIKTKIDNIEISGGGYTGGYFETLSLFTEDSGYYYGDIQHNLGTENIIVQVWNSTLKKVVSPYNIEIINTNTVRIWFTINTDSYNINVLANGTGGTTSTTYTETITNFTLSDNIYYTTINHKLDSNLVSCTFYDSTSNLQINPTDVEIIDNNNIKVWFETNPISIDIIIISGSATGIDSKVSVTGDDEPGYLQSKIGKSLVVDSTSDIIILDGDEINPGNSKYYGTDNSGIKGFHSFISEVTTYETTISLFDESGGIYYKSITHNLNKRPVIVQCYLTSTWEQILPLKIELTTVNTIKIEFDIDPSSIEVIIKK